MPNTAGGSPAWEEKMNAVNTGLEKAPKDADLLYQKGLLYAEAQQPEAAIECFSLALIQRPFSAAIRAQRGRKHIGIEKYAMAVSDMRLAALLDPDDWEIQYYMGVAAYLGGDYAFAKEAHTAARDLMLKNHVKAIPATVDWYWMCCMRLGQPEEAKQALDTYITADMETEDGDYLCRTLLYKGELSPDGFVERGMADIRNPDRPRIYELMLMFGLANWLHYQRRNAEAVPLLREVAQSPDNRNLFAVKQAMALLDMLGENYQKPAPY
jgi:tetratricopeptide (TPR) repeat protein